jgi:hypothetical protein
MHMALHVKGFTDLLSGGSVEGSGERNGRAEDLNMHMALHVKRVH